eukprot:139068-Prorocentrum_minimum.AAC.4
MSLSDWSILFGQPLISHGFEDQVRRLAIDSIDKLYCSTQGRGLRDESFAPSIRNFAEGYFGQGSIAAGIPLLSCAKPEGTDGGQGPAILTSVLGFRLTFCA